MSSEKVMYGSETAHMYKIHGNVILLCLEVETCRPLSQCLFKFAGLHGVAQLHVGCQCTHMYHSSEDLRSQKLNVDLITVLASSGVREGPPGDKKYRYKSITKYLLATAGMPGRHLNPHCVFLQLVGFQSSGGLLSSCGCTVRELSPGRPEAAALCLRDYRHTGKRSSRWWGPN